MVNIMTIMLVLFQWSFDIETCVESLPTSTSSLQGAGDIIIICTKTVNDSDWRRRHINDFMSMLWRLPHLESFFWKLQLWQWQWWLVTIVVVKGQSTVIFVMFEIFIVFLLPGSASLKFIILPVTTMTFMMIDRNHNSLTARQYIIELLLKGLHRLEYRGYDRFVLWMMMVVWQWWWQWWYLMTCKPSIVTGKHDGQICTEFWIQLF